MVFVELSPHAGVLAALAGQHEHDFAAQVGQVMVAGQLRMGLAGAQRIQGVQKLFARISGGHRRGDHRPIRVMGAGGGQAVGHIGQIQVGMADQVVVQPVGLRAQRRGGARRHRPHQQPELHTGLPGRGLRVSRFGRRGGGLLQDQVRVGAADPERGHRRGAGMIGDRPGHRLGEQANGAG